MRLQNRLASYADREAPDEVKDAQNRSLSALGGSAERSPPEPAFSGKA